MASQVWPLLALSSAESVSDTGLRVDVYSSAGAKLDAGPVTKVLSANYTLTLAQIGNFTMRVPAEDDRSSILTEGNEIRIYRGGEGLVFRGLIESTTTTIAEDGETVLEVSGPSVARQLVWEVEDPGSSLNAVPLGVAVTRLLAGTAWNAGEIGTASTVVTTPLDGASRWVALNAVADSFQMHLRENNRDKTIDIGAFGTNPQNLVFQNIESVSPNLQTNPRLVPIQRLRILGETMDVVNSVVPRGQQTGITGEQWTLANSTRTTPYTIQTRTGPDGKTVYYLEDSTSVSTYGRRKKVVQFKTAQPLGLTSTDFENAANTLYDEAVTWLQRHKDKQTAYEVVVVGLKHYYNGQPMLRVGDTVKLVFNGIAEDINGRRAWKSVNANLYVMSMTRMMEGDQTDRWRLTVSTVPRQLATDGNMTAELLAQMQATQGAPSPYVLFGANRMRMDPEGIQLKTPTPASADVPMLFWVNEFSDDPESEEPRAYISGRADPSTATFPNGIFTHRLESISGNRKATLRHSVVSDGSAAHLMEFWHGSGAPSQDVEYGQLYVGGTHYHRFLGGDKVEFSGIPIQISSIIGEPSTLADGMIWYRTDTDKFYGYANGVVVEFSTGAGMSLIVKDADETVNNSTTLQDDDDLLFAVAANEKWQFEGVLYYDSGATPDIKFTFAGPAGSVGVFGMHATEAASASGQKDLGTAQGFSGAGAGTLVMVKFYGGIANGGTAGSLKLQWAQNTADVSDTIVHAGSYIKYQQQ